MTRLPVLSLAKEEVIFSIQQYQSAVARSSRLQDRMAQARAWYAVRNNSGRWLFAPSKWVGYQGMAEETYLDSSVPLDGRRTEAQLRQWFHPVKAGDTRQADLRRQLRQFTLRFDKEPCAAARVNLPIDGTVAVVAAADETPGLILRLIRTLPVEQQSAIRQALR